MVFLLDEILTDIFLSLSHKNGGSKNIEKFMLSGRQQFEIFLNYFRQTNSVCVKPNCFELYVKEKYWTFSYNFKFASFISNIAANSIRIMKIEFNQESIVLDNLLINGLTEVYLNGDISEKYLDQLHSITTLNLVGFQRCKIRFKDLVLIRSVGTKLSLIIDFQEIIKENSQNTSFPTVQDLSLKGRFLSSDITSESLKIFHNNVFKIFPNLQNISVYYTTVNASWLDIFKLMNIIEPNIFDNIVTNAVGEIRFDYSEWNILLSEVNDKINENINAETERNDSILKRTIAINENLNFIFSLYFRRTERRRRRFK
uniref:LRR containing protein n=1 Tax=Panagrolaimus sp. PS1159 TaxID=55785 RepID=A0AC35F2H3_9BILA